MGRRNPFLKQTARLRWCSSRPLPRRKARTALPTRRLSWEQDGTAPTALRMRNEARLEQLVRAHAYLLLVP